MFNMGYGYIEIFTRHKSIFTCNFPDFPSLRIHTFKHILMERRIIAGYFIALVILLLIIVSCKKETPCIAGTGGNLSFTIYLQHNGQYIPNQEDYPDTVFVKYNTLEKPG